MRDEDNRVDKGKDRFLLIACRAAISRRTPLSGEEQVVEGVDVVVRHAGGPVMPAAQQPAVPTDSSAPARPGV